MRRGTLMDPGGGVAVPRALRTGNALERMRGLLGRPPLAPGEGLLIEPCGSVHTAGMAYPIDVVFLDREWRVLKQVPGLRPWRMAGALGGRLALELPAGTLAGLALGAGRRLEWRDER